MFQPAAIRLNRKGKEKMSKNKHPTGRQERNFMGASIRAASDGESDRRFLLSFSSEEPYARWFGTEILSHAEGSVDLARLNGLGTVLFNHDRNAVVGRIVNAHIANGRGEAEIEFDTDDQSEVVRRKVEGGSLKGVSVGYAVNNWETVEAGAVSTDGRFTGPCEIATKWEPLEISIVSVPADATVGVGREMEEFREKLQEEEKNMDEKTKTPQEQAPVGNTAHSVDEAAVREEAEKTERARGAEIYAICREWDMKPEEFIKSGAGADEVRQAALEKVAEKRGTTEPISVRKIEDEKDKYMRAVPDALMLRGQVAVEKPAEGAAELRGMGLRSLMRDALVRLDGLDSSEVLRMSDDSLMRQFFTPTSLIPSIFDQTIEKSYRAGYNTLPATFELWTAEGTLSDFKSTHYQYRANAAGEFLLVPEGGELKHDIPKDEMTPTRKLSTFGRQFTMSREAFINDDIGYLTTIPSRYAASAKRTLNAQVYQLLAGNATIYDGVQLFDAAHGNVAASAGALSVGTLMEAIKAMRTQKNSDGQMIGASPRYLIVPVGLEMYARMLLTAPTIRTGAWVAAGSQVEMNNPLPSYGIQVVGEPELDARLATGEQYAWFLTSDPATVDTVQVDYLNGNKYPVFRRMEKPGQLGFIWDIYLDWGVNVLDYVGMYKNAGAAPSDI